MRTLAALLLVSSLAGCYGPGTLEYRGPIAPAGSGMAYMEVMSRSRLTFGDGYHVAPLGYVAFDLERGTAEAIDHVDRRTFGHWEESCVYEEPIDGQHTFYVKDAEGRTHRLCEGWGLPFGASATYAFAVDASGEPVFSFFAETAEDAVFGKVHVRTGQGARHALHIDRDWYVFRFSASSERYSYLVVRKPAEGSRWTFRTLRLDLETGAHTVAAEGSFSALDAAGNLIENYEDRGLQDGEYPIDSRVRLIEGGATRILKLARPNMLPLVTTETVGTTGWVMLWYDDSMLFHPLTGRWIVPDPDLFD